GFRTDGTASCRFAVVNGAQLSRKGTHCQRGAESSQLASRIPMQAPGSSTIALLVLLPLLAWRIYTRFRRMVGRQRLSKVRPWITIAIFGLLVVLLALAALSRPERLVSLGGGLLLGVALAQYGLQRTK